MEYGTQYAPERRSTEWGVTIDFLNDTPARIKQLLFDRSQNEAYSKTKEAPLHKIQYLDLGLAASSP